MPNRILKESICTSENIDQLTDFQETFFYRLMVNCDDFGRFDARPKILSSRLYPLRSVPVETVEEALEALRSTGLIIIYLVDGHPYLQMRTWEKHQQKRATKSKYPDPAADIFTAVDITCNQLISTDDKCPRNRIRNRDTYNENRESESGIDAREALMDDADAHKIQSEQNRVLDAADDAGFKVSNSVRAALIRLYSEHGIEKVLAGIASCVKHGAPNLAYLEACMKDNPKPQPQPKVIAQDFEQRDYSNVPDEMMSNLADEVAAFMAAKAGAG